jgi:1-phosphofructokinase
MIVTVTPNPSLDRSYDLEHLVRGEVNRAAAVHHHPGGKGINVSRALACQGHATVAVLPVGGHVGARLVGMLADVDVEVAGVEVRGETRTNITLAEAAGPTTKINAPGPTLEPAEVDALVSTVGGLLRPPVRYVVVAGSVPRGADGLQPRLAALAARAGVPLVIDTSGPALAAAVEHGGIALLKPNDEELAELVTVADAVTAARDVGRRGVRELLVSLGAHGALLVTADDVWWAGGPALVPLSTVGAGDTTLAGFLAQDGLPADRLRTAVAWGRAAVLSPGSEVPAPEDVDVDAVRVVHRPDPDLALKEL